MQNETILLSDLLNGLVEMVAMPFNAVGTKRPHSILHRRWRNRLTLLPLMAK